MINFKNAQWKPEINLLLVFIPIRMNPVHALTSNLRQILNFILPVTPEYSWTFFPSKTFYAFLLYSVWNYAANCSKAAIYKVSFIDLYISATSSVEVKGSHLYLPNNESLITSSSTVSAFVTWGAEISERGTLELHILLHQTRPHRWHHIDAITGISNTKYLGLYITTLSQHHGYLAPPCLHVISCQLKIQRPIGTLRWLPSWFWLLPVQFTATWVKT